MTLTEIAQRRLVAQQLAGTSIKTAPELVAFFAAIQAQEFGPSKWGMGLRLNGIDDATIEKDFTEGRILRTHLLRPTWHFIAAEDIRWLLMLTAPRVNAINNYIYKREKLEPSDFDSCNHIMAQMLGGGKQLPRDALNAEFRKHGIIANGVRLTCIMMKAELDGLICSGARQGKQFTYALLEERVPKAKTKTRDEALSELTKRYFKSRGPATVADFSAWSGLSLTDCRNGIEMTQSCFASETLCNETYYFHESVVSNQQENGLLQLLPIYDEYVIGYKNRNAILQSYRNQNEKPNVVFDNMIIFEGQIIGSWKRVFKSKHIEIEHFFLKKPTAKQWAAFGKCVTKLETFYRMDVHFNK